MRVPKIMYPHSRQLSATRNRSPRPVEISPWFIFLLRGDNKFSLAGDFVQNRNRGPIKHNCFFSALGVWQQQQSTLKIHVLPFEGKDLAKTSAGEDQQPQCRRSVLIDV